MTNSDLQMDICTDFLIFKVEFGANPNSWEVEYFQK